MTAESKPGDAPNCMHCGEALGIEAVSCAGRAGYHRECLLRIVVGSVGHIEGKCSCYGGVAHDPEGMTPREAARAAADLYERTALCEFDCDVDTPAKWERSLTRRAVNYEAALTGGDDDDGGDGPDK